MALQNFSKKDLKMGLTKKQRSWIYTGFLLSVIALLFIVNNLNGEADQGPYPPNYVPASQKVSAVAPDFALPTVEGKQLKLSDYKGKVVIIDFWATWCPPCRKGIPDLIDLKKRYGAKGFEVIGISLDTETKSQVPDFVKTNGMNYPVVYGNQNVTQLYGGIEAIPTTFVIDKQGKIVATYQGLVPAVTFENHLKKLL
jgi:peroxiredoxin